MPLSPKRDVRAHGLILIHDGAVQGHRPLEPFDALLEHVRTFFGGHAVEVLHHDHGSIRTRVPAFHVLRVEPGPRLDLWTYVSAGVWEVTQRDGHGLEFVVTTQRDEAAPVDLLTITAYYHAGPPEQRLDIGHTIPIGAPWLDDSACDHLLVSVPYPYGPDLEVCAWQRGHARLLWLLPITEAERDYRATNGLEALEARFDEHAIEFWDPRRPSVV